MITIHEVPQRSAEWLALRLGRFTASNAADLMAKEDSQAFQGLIQDVAWERLTGSRAGDVYVNAAMQYGIDRESEARTWYEMETGLRVWEVGFVTRDDAPSIGVSPDGFVTKFEWGSEVDALLEIKCPQPRQHLETLTRGAVPSRYRWQLQMQLWVCDSPAVDFVSYRHELGGLIIRVERNEKDIDALVKRVTLAEEMAQELVNKAKGGRSE